MANPFAVVALKKKVERLELELAAARDIIDMLMEEREPEAAVPRSQMSLVYPDGREPEFPPSPLIDAGTAAIMEIHNQARELNLPTDTEGTVWLHNLVPVSKLRTMTRAEVTAEARRFAAEIGKPCRIHITTPGV